MVKPWIKSNGSLFPASVKSKNKPRGKLLQFSYLLDDMIKPNIGYTIKKIIHPQYRIVDVLNLVCDGDC